MATDKIEAPRRYELNSVVEAFSIIAKMFDANDSLGLTQLCDSTRVSKNKTFRLLSTLEQCGIVEKSPQKKYKFGIATVGIARKILARSLVLDNVRPYMEELAKVFNEAVYFAHYKAGEAVLVDYADCCHPIKVTSLVGKVIQLRDSTSLVMRSNSMVIFDDITFDIGGLDRDVTTVNMPFITDNGTTIGALVVLAPTFRMSLERIKTEIVPVLKEFMQRQSLQLPKIMEDIFLPSARPVEREFSKHPALVPGRSTKKITRREAFVIQSGDVRQ